MVQHLSSLVKEKSLGITIDIGLLFVLHICLAPLHLLFHLPEIIQLLVIEWLTPFSFTSQFICHLLDRPFLVAKPQIISVRPGYLFSP